MWWLILLLLLLFIYLYYRSDYFFVYRSDSSIGGQAGGGIGSPRNYLIYSNGNTYDPSAGLEVPLNRWLTDPNNSFAVLSGYDSKPHPTLEYLQNEYNLLRIRAKNMELDNSDFMRMKKLEKDIMNLEGQMRSSAMSGQIPPQNQYGAGDSLIGGAYGDQCGGYRRPNQTGGMVIDARMGSDVLTGTGSGPPISPPLGPLPGAPIANTVSQLGYLKDSLTNLLQTVYRIPEVVSDIVNPAINRADPYYGIGNAGNPQVPTVELAQNLSTATTRLYNLQNDVTVPRETIVNTSNQIGYLSQQLESRLSVEGNMDLSRQQAAITNLLRGIDAYISASEVRERTYQAQQNQMKVYQGLGGAPSVAMAPVAPVPVAPVPVTSQLTVPVTTTSTTPVTVTTTNNPPMVTTTTSPLVTANTVAATQNAMVAQQQAQVARQNADAASVAAQQATQQVQSAQQAQQAALQAQAIVQPGSQQAAVLTDQAVASQAALAQATNQANQLQQVAAAADANALVAERNAAAATQAAAQAQTQVPNTAVVVQPPAPTPTPIPTVTTQPIPTPVPVASQPMTTTTTAVVGTNGSFARQPRTVPMPEYSTTLSEQERWLRAHNFFRSINCAPPVTWNAELANLAAGWGNKLANDPPRPGGMANIDHPSTPAEEAQYLTMKGPTASRDFGGRVGQNLAWGGPDIINPPGQQSYRKEVEDVVADWYEEVNLPNFGSSGFSVSNGQISFTPIEERTRQIQANLGTLPGCPPGLPYKYGAPQNCNPGTGHFTQVVWKGTSEIGCAKVPHRTIPGTYVWVCNYNFPGNIQGEYAQNVIDPNTC